MHYHYNYNCFNVVVTLTRCGFIQEQYTGLLEQLDGNTQPSFLLTTLTIEHYNKQLSILPVHHLILVQYYPHKQYQQHLSILSVCTYMCTYIVM